MGKGFDLVGQRFGKLTVVEYLYSKGDRSTNNRPGRMWLCKCDCGGEKIASSYDLRKGNITSCGCLWQDTIKKAQEANLKHGFSGTRLYNCFYSMHYRTKKEPNWIKQGIKVCEEWQTFEPFAEWALSHGYADNLSLDRINTHGNYEPSNCRWADRLTQMNNTTQNVYVTIGEETHTVAEWSRICGVSDATIRKRIEHGYQGEDLIKPTYRVWTPDERSAAMVKKPITINGETHSVYEWAKISGLQAATIRRRIYLGWPPELLIAPTYKPRRGHAVLKEYQLTTPQERM